MEKEDFRAIGLRIPGYRAAKIQVDVTEEHGILEPEAQRALLKKVPFAT